MLSCPYFVKKHPFSQKHTSHISFFKFCMKHPLLSCPYFVKKRQFCQNYPILWAKKVNKMVFFPIFHEKSMLSFLYFIKNSSILSKTQCSQAHILSKHFLSLKNSALISFCIQILYEKKSLLSCPYLVIKRQFCRNYTICWVKKVNKMPIFSKFPR